MPEVVGIRALTRHSTAGNEGKWDGVNEAEGSKGDEVPKEKPPGPCDGRKSGEGGIETFDRDNWLNVLCGTRLFLFPLLFGGYWLFERGVPGKETGVVMDGCLQTVVIRWSISSDETPFFRWGAG